MLVGPLSFPCDVFVIVQSDGIMLQLLGQWQSRDLPNFL